ncbi:MAG TPA: SIS domain-containing protein [Baekduia sp.]|nr:SIS domain-containing protein [Baekduia sp.]
MPGARMAAEMAEQPRVLAELAGRRPDLVARVRAVLPQPLAGIVLVARGSSDNAAIYGRYVLELAAGRPVALAAPSLLTRYGARDDLSGWLAIGVSQSGRTPEIVAVLEAYRAAGACAIAVTNDRSGPLAAAADATLDTAAGAERAVPATKTVTAQLAAFAILAEAAARDGRLPWGAADWSSLPAAVEALLSDAAPAERAAEKIAGAAGLVAIARGLLLGAALEAALKLKETTGILAEGASAADFLHGPIAIVRRELPVVTFAAPGPTTRDVEELAAAVRERGGRVLRCAPGEGADLPLPADVPEGLAAIPAVVRAQQLARATALARGVDPDAPFGLSKVTATD